MKCWESQGFVPSSRSCHLSDKQNCRSFRCLSSRSCNSYTRFNSTSEITFKQDRAQQKPVLFSRRSFKRAKFQPQDDLRGGVSAQNAAAGLAPQPPLPPLPIERGDNTLTRTLSGLILGAFGSLCIYSGGLLFTGDKAFIN